MKSVGRAIADSGLPRSIIFLVVKVGSPFAMGYDDITAQIKQGLIDSGTSYYDSIYVASPRALMHARTQHAHTLRALSPKRRALCTLAHARARALSHRNCVGLSSRAALAHVDRQVA